MDHKQDVETRDSCGGAANETGRRFWMWLVLVAGGRFCILEPAPRMDCNSSHFSTFLESDSAMLGNTARTNALITDFRLRTDRPSYRNNTIRIVLDCWSRA